MNSKGRPETGKDAEVDSSRVSGLGYRYGHDGYRFGFRPGT